jgi:hypothetical protein
MPTKLYDDERQDEQAEQDREFFAAHPDLQELDKKHGQSDDDDFAQWEKELADEPTEKELDSNDLTASEDDDDDTDESDDDEEDKLASVVNDQEVDYYKPTKEGAAILGGGFFKKRAAIFAATGVVGLLFSFGGFIGFLNQFRLKHLMENFNFHAFARYNAAVDRRSDKWMRAYFQTRLLEWNGTNAPDGDGNTFFRANKVDTNHPFRDWYRTMRTSKFEADLLKTSGIRFASVVDSNGRIRPGRIDISGRTVDIVPDGVDSFAVIDDLTPAQLDRVLGNIDGKVTEVFETDKAARRAIKDAVDKNTRKWQVIKRRHTRKAISNMTGVRDWRFFDKTRTRIEDKKAEFKRKMIKKVFGADSRSGKLSRCALGLASCSSTNDPNNPDNQRGQGSADPARQADSDTPKLDEKGNPIEGSFEPTDGSGFEAAGRAAREGAEQLAKDEASEKVTEEATGKATELTERRFNSTLMEKIVKAIGGGGPVGAAKQFLDWTLKFENNLSKGPNGRSKIGDAVYMARLAGGLMLAYATFSTIADQMQSGEVDPAQVDAAMNYMDGANKSEAFSFVFEGQDFGDNPLQTRTRSDGSVEKVDKCKEGDLFDADDYVPFCDSYKPNGGTKISGLEDAWNTYVSDSPLGAVLQAYKKAKDNIVGRFFSAIGNLVGDVLGNILSPIMDALGLTDLIGGAAAWLSERVLSWIGVKPCMTGAEDTGGMAPNCILGGAAGSAESAARTAGGVFSFVGSNAYNYSQQLAIDYVKEQYDSMSVYDRYFALDNPHSYSANLLFSFSFNTSLQGTVGNLVSLRGNLLKGFGMLGGIFGGRALAADDSALIRDTSTFSGVDHYVIPKECVEDLDPLDPDYYQKATNSTTVAHDAATLGTTDAFSAALYSKNGDSLSRGEIEDIYNTYNCAALDNVVKGGLGGIYGFNNDDGYKASASDSGGIGNFVAGTMPDVSGHQNDPCPAGLKDLGVHNSKAAGPIKLCDVHGYMINVIMATNFNNMYNDMKAAGFSVPGGYGNFRSYETQVLMHQRSPSSTAEPGKSNHELGLAVDTACSGGGGEQYRPWMPGKDRGLPAFQKALAEHPCLNWLHQNSSKYSLLLQCDGQGSSGGEIAASTGGCETWHLSPTGK